jgi:hypothetical protein
MIQKNFKLRKSLVVCVIIVITASTSIAFGQGNTWKLSGNNNVGNNDFIGSKNKSDFVIKTDNLERIRVTTDNYTIINDSVRIKGPLYIGDSSLVVGGVPGFPFDNILSTNGRINFGRTFNFANVRVGIGTTSPQYKLHLHDMRYQFSPPPAPPVEPNPVYMAFTNEAQGGGTGVSATDGFLVGIAANGNAQLIQQENLPMQFLVNGSTIPSTPFTSERMRITAGPQTISGELENNITRVGIWRTGATGEPNPLSLLQIGEPATPSLAGHRDWMDVGTYSNISRSNMYVGMLEIKDSNRLDAIIDWGSPVTATPRLLRFIYTTEQTGNLLSANYEGLEASRWWSNGEVVQIGFGGNPGTNLYFMGSEDPTQTVEINSPGIYVADAPGFSGLRFTDLRENSSHVPLNPDQGVLSVNESGDVIYVDAAGGVGGADDDWFVAGTVLPNANIDDNIYTQGFTGLGDFSTIIPQSLLHLYQSDTALYAQFTNDNTGNSATDGFLAGINEDGVAQLNQQENKNMLFYTSNKLCLTITANGKIKINSLASNKPHLLLADKDGTLMLYKLKKKEQKLQNLKHELNV